jgi:hypothetical protein
MAGQNTLIIANDYNVIQSKIALVLGSGSGNKGYGQTVSSSQVGQYSTITVAQWSALRDDIARARQHQTGVTLGTKAPEDAGYNAATDLPIPTNAKQVKDTWRSAYLQMATDADTNYLTAPPPAGQASRVDVVTQQIRNTAWNGTITQSVVITWPTADDARYFFNTGSQIEFSSERSGGSAGLKNSTWTAMLAGMGTIAMDWTKTTCTGTGTTGGLGFYDLTTTNGVIFEKDAPAGAYAPNKYYIYARVNDTGANRRILYFDINWGDDSSAPPSYPDPGFGIDENVDGTITSTVQVYRASGSNVTVPTPSAITTAIN